MGARKTPRIHAEIQLETAAGFNDYRFDLTHLSAGDTVMVLERSLSLFGPQQNLARPIGSKLHETGKEAKLPEQGNKTAKTICNLLRQCATYQFHDTSVNSAIRLRWDVSDRCACARMAAIWLQCCSICKENDLQRYKLIVRQIQRVLPTFKDFVLEPGGPAKWNCAGWGCTATKLAHLTSDGSLRLFCLLTLLNFAASNGCRM